MSLWRFGSSLWLDLRKVSFCNDVDTIVVTVGLGRATDRQQLEPHHGRGRVHVALAAARDYHRRRPQPR